MQISNTGGTGSTLSSFAYTYTDANQRVRVTLSDGSYWLYEYDRLGQVIAGRKYWSDGTPVAGQQFEYGFDDIGNRKVARRGGDENGWNLRQSIYTANLLNQYTQRTLLGYVDILGIAVATNPVYVNGQLAYRRGEYFRRELSVNNASGPVWQQVTVTASGETPVTGNVFVPKTPEAFTYDLDGNMTSDGRWSYTWDAENRLVKVESRSDTPTGSWCRVEWTFDALGRRIRQRTLVWTNNTWVSGEELKFISDPMLFGRHVVELNATNNALVRSYVWGLDLSGTMGGAGGVGGLLWVTLHTASGAAAGTHFCAYDGNGNIVALSAASDGSEAARYEYGPFGEQIRVTGPAATNNPFRFSTKRTCNTTDLVLYEYRGYNPSLGRWLSRDLNGEDDWQNVVELTGNDSVNYVDDSGLQRFPRFPKPRDPRRPRIKPPICFDPPCADPKLPIDDWPIPDAFGWSCKRRKEALQEGIAECSRQSPKPNCGCCVVFLCVQENFDLGTTCYQYVSAHVVPKSCTVSRREDQMHGVIYPDCKCLMTPRWLPKWLVPYFMGEWGAQFVYIPW